MATPAHIMSESVAPQTALQLTELERRLLNLYQKGLPLSPTPYADMAQRLGSSEARVLLALEHLQQVGVVSRVGPVFQPQRVGASTLAAMAVPHSDLQRVAAIVSHYPEVNHNYEREHHYNLWFVITAASQEHLEATLEQISQQTGLPILNLPMQRHYHIDLGFPLWC